MNLLEAIFNRLLALASQHSTLLTLAGITATILAITIYILTPRIARWFLRLKHRQPKELQKELITLVSNSELVEFYEPAQRYIEDVEDGKRPMVNAWASPYARAVKATIKNRGRIPRNQFFNAKRQINNVVKHVKVRELNVKESKTVTIDPDKPYDTYAIELQYDGHNPEKAKALLPSIGSQLGLKHMQETNDDNPMATTMIVSRTPVEDALVSMKPGVEFFENNPAVKPASLPMAVTADGRPWSLPIHHTFTYGTTGAGKSGPLFATIVQSAKFVEQGRVKLWGIDPKAADLRLFQESNLFEKIVTDTDDSIDLINHFYSLLIQRTRSVKIDLAKKQTGQNFQATKETPWNYLLIDELFVLRSDLLKSKEGKEAWNTLEKIAALGRAAGFYIITASQYADIENLSNLRQNLVNFIVLSQPSEHMNKILLAPEAAANGFDSTQIPPSNEANGYRYSGIGFVKNENGAIAKVRFGYLSKDDLIAFILAHPKDEPIDMDDRAIETANDDDVFDVVFDETVVEDDGEFSWDLGGDADEEALPDIRF